MGRNSQARRAARGRARAKAGARARRRAQGVPGRSEAGPFGRTGEASRPAAPSVEAAVHALWLGILGSADGDPRVRSRLDRLASRPVDVVDAVTERVMLGHLAVLWDGGWQPVEVARHARRLGTAPMGRLAALAITADHDGRTGQRIDPRWSEQVRALGQRSRSTAAGWIGGWRAREGLDLSEGIRATHSLLRELNGLPRLDTLVAPPGAPESVIVRGPARRASSGSPMLERVRKLLAKAEATEFEAEAATFTAKAQELMTRHAIDEALLREREPSDGPRLTRLPVDAPYADAKAALLSVVASANRCKAVSLGSLGLCTVIGHTDDLETVELLFTSLLVQAQKALGRAGSGTQGRRARTASYRSSFFLAYATRIGERLAVAHDHAVADVGTSALPVLRRRQDAVAEVIAEMYGDSLVSAPVRGGYDAAGLASGRLAADLARLTGGELVVD